MRPRLGVLTVMMLFPVGLGAQEANLLATRPTVLVGPIVLRQIGSERPVLSPAELKRLLETQLKRRGQVELVDGAQSPPVPADSAGDQEASRLGLLAGAQHVLVGSIAPEGRRTRIEIRFVDVESGGVTDVFTRSGTQRELAALVRDVANQLEASLGLGEPAAQAGATRVPAAANLAYARGLDYEKRGRKDAAATLFERALQLFPRHDQARSALERVRR